MLKERNLNDFDTGYRVQPVCLPPASCTHRNAMRICNTTAAAVSLQVVQAQNPLKLRAELAAMKHQAAKCQLQLLSNFNQLKAQALDNHVATENRSLSLQQDVRSLQTVVCRGTQPPRRPGETSTRPQHSHLAPPAAARAAAPTASEAAPHPLLDRQISSAAMEQASQWGRKACSMSVCHPVTI
jgi:hypothetical protein